MRRIHVMAAVIRRADGHILIAKRPDAAHQGGLWEFPGGKLEAVEPRLAGLARELLEELGIQVTRAKPLIDIRHDYPDKSIRLDVWSVSAFTGHAHGAEGQLVRWVAPEELGQYQFPAANRPIVAAATLPQRYLITPDNSTAEQLSAGLERARAQGVRMVQLRQTGLSQPAYDRLASTLMARFADAFVWMLKGDQPPPNGAGWHLTGRQLRALHAAGWSKPDPFAARPPLPPGDAILQTLWERPPWKRPPWKRSPDREGVEKLGSDPFAAGPPLPPGDTILQTPWERRPRREGVAWDGLLAASCHAADELQMAAEIGVDFVSLSPVLPTQSHPGAPHLGWLRAAELIELANVPVYLLGGLGSDDLDQAQASGAQGIAGISGLWPDKARG